MFRGVIHAFEQGIQLAKIFFAISLVCFAPQLLFKKPKKIEPTLLHTASNGAFKLGIETLTAQYLSQISPNVGNIGLVTQLNSGKNASLQILMKKNIGVKHVFYPYDGELIDSYQTADLDKQFQDIPATMIHSAGFGNLLNDIEILLVDLQGVGMGYMAAIRLLFQSLYAGVRRNIPVVILDRPNMLGNKIEGSLLRPSDLSAQVPMRYGMTIGELAHYYNIHALEKRVNLHIVPMCNYDRSAEVPKSDAIFSPKIRTVDTAWGYSLCGMLAHVRPFDVGLETDAPYRCIALPRSVVLPEQKWYQLKIMLRNLGIESSICRYYCKQKQEACRGLRLHIKNIYEVDSFKALLVTLEFFKRSGVVLHFSDTFDRFVGSPLVRRYVQGKIPRSILADKINQGLEEFYRKAFGTFMYHPLPQVVLV